jgi:hypothetical protein
LRVGLLAHGPVIWLITSEPDVRKKIEQFILGLSEPHLDVAGPPTDADAIKYHDNPGGAVTLPCVRLNLEMTKHHLTGQRAVKVTCSDSDLEEIKSWQRKAEITAALKGKHNG